MSVIFGHIDFRHLNHSVINITESHSWIHRLYPILVLNGAKILLACVLSLGYNRFASVAVSLHVYITIVHCLLLNRIIREFNHRATPFVFEQRLRALWTRCLRSLRLGWMRSFLFCMCSRTSNCHLVKLVVNFIYLLKDILLGFFDVLYLILNFYHALLNSFYLYQTFIAAFDLFFKLDTNFLEFFNVYFNLVNSNSCALSGLVSLDNELFQFDFHVRNGRKDLVHFIINGIICFSKNVSFHLLKLFSRDSWGCRRNSLYF